MMGYAKPHFAPAFRDSVRAGVGVERGFVCSAEARQILEHDFRERPLESLLIGVAPLKQHAAQRVDQIFHFTTVSVVLHWKMMLRSCLARSMMRGSFLSTSGSNV